MTGTSLTNVTLTIVVTGFRLPQRLRLVKPPPPARSSAIYWFDDDA